jgi:hypothetical protein
MYRLKKTSAAFELVDGLLAGRKYLHGKLYAEIPPEHRGRFEAIETRPEANAAAAEASPKAEGGKKK